MPTYPAICSEGLLTNENGPEALASLLGRVDRKLSRPTDDTARRNGLAPISLVACPSEPFESLNAILSVDGFSVVRLSICTEPLVGAVAIATSNKDTQKQYFTDDFGIEEDAAFNAVVCQDWAYVVHFRTHSTSVRSKHAAD